MLTAIIQYSFPQNDFKPNYDESKVPVFDLPNPLKTFSEKEVKTVKSWEKNRRPEILDFFTQNVYGQVPAELRITSSNILEQSDDALDGKARRKLVELSFEKNGKELHFTILVYIPKNIKKAPIFMGYNFYEEDPLITSDILVADNESFGIVHNQLTEKPRNVLTNRWVIEKMLDAGFGLATIDYSKVDPDKDDMSEGIHSLFYSDGKQKRTPNDWGTLAAWSWGLSRVMDYFEKDPDIDVSKVIIFGHSRQGKAALWAGATDQRFAGVISNNSGCGGAALSKRRFGETVWRINRSFPHWFSDNFKRYNDNEEQLPVDQHELLALIAPRPLYVASAEEDLWADPRGEFLSAFFATPVYKLYGKQGIPSSEMPKVNQPIQNTVAYHIRTGKHNLTDYDWVQYIKWAKEQLF